MLYKLVFERSKDNIRIAQELVWCPFASGNYCLARNLRCGEVLGNERTVLEIQDDEFSAGVLDSRENSS